MMLVFWRRRMVFESSQGPSLLRLRRCARGLCQRGPGRNGSTSHIRGGREVDGAGGGCFVGIVCRAGFHFSESKVELDEAGGRRQTRQGHTMVTGVNGTLKDEVNVKGSKEATTPAVLSMIHFCKGFINEHGPHNHPSPLFTSAI